MKGTEQINNVHAWVTNKGVLWIMKWSLPAQWHMRSDRFRIHCWKTSWSSKITCYGKCPV